MVEERNYTTTVRPIKLLSTVAIDQRGQLSIYIHGKGCHVKKSCVYVAQPSVSAYTRTRLSFIPTPALYTETDSSARNEFFLPRQDTSNSCQVIINHRNEK